jgi:NhaP-type Na+/H+ or K+/H+ antiporter
VDVQILALVALAILGFGMVSRRTEKSPLTPPMVFVAFGLGLGVLGLLELDAESAFFQLLAELTLVLLLFTDAARIDLRQLVREHTIPVRLLSIGLPLTIVAGAAVALWTLEGLSIWEAAALAAILAPTDAALGQAVVSNQRVPVRIRQALNVESGLNDGVALPAVVILLSCMGAAEGGEGVAYWTVFTAKQVLLGPLAGVVVGYLGGMLVKWGQKSGWMSHTFQDLALIALALGAFSGAELVGGNGFIAAFTAGLTLGNTAREACKGLWEFGEAEGNLMALLVFMIFGAALVPPALARLDAAAVFYVLASLTVVRMVPVAVSLAGLKLRRDTRLFLGWFGPRGIASILFALLLLEEVGTGDQVERMFAIIVTAVLFSVVLHGLTAYPGAMRYAERLHGMDDEEKASASEHQEVGEMPVRRRFAEERHG